MNTISIIYILNATLLLLHEIESAYEKEWEILKLPGGISGFLLMHIPIIMVLFYGMAELEKLSRPGLIISMIAGACGILPLIVHKFLVKKQGCFDRALSNVIIFLNAACGAFLVYLSSIHLF